MLPDLKTGQIGWSVSRVSDPALAYGLRPDDPRLKSLPLERRTPIFKNPNVCACCRAKPPPFEVSEEGFHLCIECRHHGWTSGPFGLFTAHVHGFEAIEVRDRHSDVFKEAVDLGHVKLLIALDERERDG